MQIFCGISEFSWVMLFLSFFLQLLCLSLYKQYFSQTWRRFREKSKFAEMSQNVWAKNFFAGSVSCCLLSCINYKSKGIVWNDVVVQSFCSNNIAAEAFHVHCNFYNLSLSLGFVIFPSYKEVFESVIKDSIRNRADARPSRLVATVVK